MMKKTSNRPTDSKTKEPVGSANEPTLSKQDLLLLTPAERYFKLYGKKLSNAKVGTAFMTSYQKPKQETKSS